jgi:glycosyltransferase involved in cell wall biosynthesis
MNKLLIVSYLFPPAGGVGVQRALSLAKYLPECGFEVHVLKARNAAGPVHDPGLLKHLPASVKVHEAFTPELPFHFRQKLWRWFSGSASKGAAAAKAPAPSRRPWWKRLPVEIGRRVLCPEPEVLWVPFALRRARNIVKKYGIEAVLVTAPPFSAFLVGNALKKEFPQLRLITDFRDDWLRFYLGEFDYQKGDYTRRRAIAIERRTVELSDRVVVVTQSMLEDIRARYPDQDFSKFAFIPNGYDPEAFASFQPRQRSGSKIVVSHVGTVYSASSARYYLDALGELPAEIRSAIETRFIGRVAEEEEPFMALRKSEVRVLGFMPQEQALCQMEETDYLLLVMTDAASLTGKLFEYLATGKPILAITPADGEVARVLRETGAGWCAAPDDRGGIRDLLIQAYQRTQAANSGFTPNWGVIRKFERPRLAAEFGRLIAAHEENGETSNHARKSANA